jgi:hypothetical protein
MMEKCLILASTHIMMRAGIAGRSSEEVKIRVDRSRE